MKVSCLPVSLFPKILSGKMSIKEWARIGLQAGLDAIDLSIILLKNHTPTYIKQLREDIESEGMSITMVATYPDFSHPDPIQREREYEYLRHDIAIASNLGAKYVRILAGQAHPDTGVEEGIGWVIEYFKSVSSLSEKFKVKLLFENHSRPEVWDLVDFSHPTEIFLKILEGIRNTNIGINFDTANTLVYGDDPIQVLDSVIKRVETIHVADTASREKLHPVLLGMGIVPFRKIFSLLKQNGFDGWLCIEEASNNGKEGIKKAADFVHKIWSEV